LVVAADILHEVMSPTSSRLRRSLERAGPLGVALILGALLVVSSALSYRDARSAAVFVGERQGIGLLHRLDTELAMRQRRHDDEPIAPASLKATLDANRALGLTYVGLLDGERVVANAGTPLLGDTHPQVGAPAAGRGRMRMVSPARGGPPFDHSDGPPRPPPFSGDGPPVPPPPSPIVDDDHGPDFRGGPPTFGPPPGPGPPGPDRHHHPLVIEFEPISSADGIRRALASLWLSSSAAVLLTAAAWILSARRHRAERAEAQLSAQRHLARLGEMSAVLAHEIRNPLAALKGHAQLLAEQVAEGDVAARVDRVVKEAVRLEQLTNDLLEFARSGAIRVAPANPAELLQRASRATDPARVEVTAIGAPDVVELDAARIEQVLINLIDNGLQVSPPGRNVHVAASAQGDGLLLTVRDHGTGVRPADRLRIFGPFHTTKTRGTGLGLAVASRIVELHGGRIDVIDADDGDGGALFRVFLPPRPPPPEGS
jgi:two-component system, NtrC family, sensor histidine kinase HydH